MAKRNIITIAGVLGSGKSTTAHLVAENLGYPHFSGGDFMRDLAKKRGISLAELNALGETDATIDKEIDATQKEFMNTHDQFVIDSRIGWFLAPDSFKVFLMLDSDTAAARVFHDWEANPDKRHGELVETPKTVAETKANLLARMDSERGRYKKYYDIADPYDPKNFDLVINTKENSPDKVAEIIIEGYAHWQG